MSKKYYEENFKKQIVKIYNQGNHTYRELSEQYGIAASTMRQWVIRYNNTRSFNAEDNKTDEEKRIYDSKLIKVRPDFDVIVNNSFAEEAVKNIEK